MVIANLFDEVSVYLLLWNASLCRKLSAELPKECISIFRTFLLVFLDDDLTSVKGFEAETVYDKNIYNLSGQRITTPQIGVNIINGKKVLVK